MGAGVGGIGVAAGAGGWVGAGVAAGAHAAKISEAVISTNRVTSGKRFISISIHVLYRFCTINLANYIQDLYNVKRVLPFSSNSHLMLVVGGDDFFSPKNTCIHCPLGDTMAGI
jgi:hypothetical protein